MLDFITKGFFNKKNRKNTENTPVMYAFSQDIDSYFNGEKDIMAMDAPFEYNVDYYTMANRAYNLFITNEFVRAGILRTVELAVGKGLNAIPAPDKDFLKRKYNVILDENFTKDVQSLWNLFSKNKNASHNKLFNINQMEFLVSLHAYLAGDCLVISRVVKGELEYQLVDGRNVRSDICTTASGNEIIDGVEINAKGEHVAYYVRQSDGLTKRILAKSSSGRLNAWLVYGSTAKLGTTRGYSVLGAIMQKLENIGKYTENEVMASKTNAAIALKIEQDETSNGLNPMNNTLSLRNAPVSQPDEPFENKSIVEKFKIQLRKITNAICFFVPKGQKLTDFSTTRPNVNFGAFLDANAKYIYASMGVPFEAVLLVFQNNFSSSRASLKMFEMILDIFRFNVPVSGFCQRVYRQFFELEVLKNNINAPKFLELVDESGYADDAYLQCEFVGQPIPHIDPVKEVDAVVTKLKNNLTTYELGLQELGNKIDFNTLCEKRAEENLKLGVYGLTQEQILESIKANKEAA